MKSFPSSLNRGNKNIIMNYSSKSMLDAMLSTFKNSFKNAWKGNLISNKYGLHPNSKEVNIEGLIFDNSIDKKALLEGLDFTRFRNYNGTETLKSSSIIQTDLDRKIENPYNFDNYAIAIMNKYKGEKLNVMTSSNVAANDGLIFGSSGPAKRSLFNPYNAVHVIGITENVPLLYDQKEEEYDGTPPRERNISDCSIKRLVEESAKKTSILGQARYKYADFAFCKDLGMPNNRLITLRKFSIPVGDNIFKAAAVDPKGKSKNEKGEEIVNEANNPYIMPGDIGRMCCYFDTDDNKLEDILKYSFNVTYKAMEASNEQLPSQENNHVTPLGTLVNFLNPGMNASIGQGFSGSANHLLGRAFSSQFGWNTTEYYNNEILTEYDKHKIYKPRNTIQEMEKYEGKLVFKHSFTLVFSYKLRSYQNINPKSAMLDLLANIFATTYTRGTFWGGKQTILGAPPNKSGWRKATQLIDKGEEIVDGLFNSLADGTFDAGAILGSISNILGGSFSDILGELKNVNVQKVANFIKRADGKFHFSDAAKGLLKNQLGRPELYAFSSLLDGSDTGLWHVTIGNPLNPIASIGNLIVDNVEVQHFGPLGIDDFPTELKVTVSLKHARPRDAVAMERMYTKGVGAIYMPLTSYNKRDKVFREDVEAKIGSLDYYGEWVPEKIKRNADELG